MLIIKEDSPRRVLLNKSRKEGERERKRRKEGKKEGKRKKERKRGREK